MDTTALNYQKIPKVELHRHLEGSLRVDTLVDIARQYGFDYQTHDSLSPRVQIAADDPLTVENFLSKFAVLRTFYQSPEIIQRVVREAIQDAAQDNIRYMELRFTPVALSKARNFPLDETMDWVLEAAVAAADAYSIQVNLLVSVNRHEPVAEAEAVTKLAADRLSRGIVGLDLAGDEVNFPAEPFKALFQEARQAGLKICLHAGEWSGALNVAHAITEMQADRIGHGIQVMQEPEIVQLARDTFVPFEVCITSNYQSGIISAVSEHPIKNMIEAGLNVTINTDDPGISRITLSDEYQTASQDIGITRQQLRDMILQAARSTFQPPRSKQALVNKMKSELDAWLTT